MPKLSGVNALILSKSFKNPKYNLLMSASISEISGGSDRPPIKSVSKASRGAYP